MVEDQDEIKENDPQDHDSHQQKILVNTEDEKTQCGQNVFGNEEIEVPLPHEEIHEGVDFSGSSRHMEDRKVGIQDGKQDNEEEAQEEGMAIEVNKQMGFPICLPPDGFAAPGEDILAQRPCGFLASIL
jgi:hypothetical protein